MPFPIIVDNGLYQLDNAAVSVSLIQIWTRDVKDCYVTGLY